MAEHRHKRVTRARRALSRAGLTSRPRRLVAGAGALALGATVVAVSVGATSPDDAVRPGAAAADVTDATALTREADVSRSGTRERPARRVHERVDRFEGVSMRTQRRAMVAEASRDATRKAVRQADRRLWATGDLAVWTDPKGGSRAGSIEDGDKVLVTGRKADGRTEVVLKRKARWVTSGYFSTTEPVGPNAGLSMEPCPSSAIEGGLTSGAIYVYRSVCNAFPEITTYGGRDGHGEHVNGEAIDIMTSDVELGTAIAEFLRAHASELNLYDIIWRQHIYTPERGGEGWRYMSSRGSATADHYDHVHVKVY